MSIIKYRVTALLLMASAVSVANAYAGTGKLENLMIPAPSLSHSLFRTATEQPAAVYLPPSYNDTNRHFPVVYFLPGFGCPLQYFTAYGVFQGFDLCRSLDSLIQAGMVKEMIVVMPNGLNFMGGSFYANSPVTGNWEDFIARDLVEFVDSHYRSIPAANARGISGYSMGGSGALSLAMKHPDVFNSVYALSPGIFAPGGLAQTVMFADETTIRQYLERQREFDSLPTCDARVQFMSFIDNLYKANQELEAFVYAYGTAFAPDTSKPAPFIAYPYQLEGGKLVIDSLSWLRLESGFGDWPHRIEVYRENLDQLRAITIDYGTKDEFPWISTGCAYLSRLLDSAGIHHTTQSFDGGHGDRVRERIEAYMLPFFSAQLVHR